MIIGSVKEIIKEYHIDIIHQLTYHEYQIQGKLFDMGIPFVWRPIGGGQEYNPIQKEGHFRKVDVFKEIVCKKLNYRYLMDKNVVRAIEISVEILVTDPVTYSILLKTRKNGGILEVSVYPDRNSIESYGNRNHEKIRLMYAGVMTPRKELKIIIDSLEKTYSEIFN